MTMTKLVRALLNIVFLNSPYLFEDGSRISYLVQFDILRYQSGGRMRKIADIRLDYDAGRRVFKIDTIGPWKWRDSGVPLNTPSSSGPMLTENERQDLVQKLRIFQTKHPNKYEKLTC